MENKPIYEQIRENLTPEGTLREGFRLGKGLFADGAQDGIALYHTAPKQIDDALRGEIEAAVQAFAEEDFGEAEGRFGELVRSERALTIAEAVRDCIRGKADVLNLDALYAFAKYLMTESYVVEAVKLGMAIISLFRVEEPEAVEALRILGLSDEFTLFACYALSNRENRAGEHFRLARLTHGWGRIHAVDCLEPVTPEIREWLLLEGIDNGVMPQYSAFTVYEKAEVAARLKGETLSAGELDAAARIIDALIDQGPVAGISAIEDAEEVLLAFLRQAEAAERTEATNAAVESIWRYARRARLRRLIAACPPAK